MKSMKKIYCLCVSFLLALLAGCEIIPQFNQCPSPKFTEQNNTTIEQYFLTEDLLAKFCPTETPKVLTYQVRPDVMLTAYLKEEWIYLKASNGLGKVNLYAKGLRLADFKDYSHVLPISSLKGQVLPLTIDSKIAFDMEFSIINCTCIDY